MTNFDSDTDSYEDAVNKSIAFSRQGVGYFAQRKAAHLLDICDRHLGNPDAISVVDVGCGVGLTDEYLVPHVSALHFDVHRPVLPGRRRRRNEHCVPVRCGG